MLTKRTHTLSRTIDGTKLSSVTVDGYTIPYAPIRAINLAGIGLGLRWQDAQRRMGVKRGPRADARLATLVRLGLLRVEQGPRSKTLHRTAYGAAVCLSPALAYALRTVVECVDKGASGVPSMAGMMPGAIAPTAAKSLSASGWIQRSNPGARGAQKWEPTAAGRSILALHDEIWGR